jgi:hypothetical protein
MPSSPARTLGQQGVGVGEALAEAQQIALSAPQLRLQACATLDEGLIAKIAPIQLEQIKTIEHADALCPRWRAKRS